MYKLTLERDEKKILYIEVDDQLAMTIIREISGEVGKSEELHV